MTEPKGGGDEILARIGDGVAGFDANAWDACNPDANPFVGHAFLSALETSGSVGPGTGWQPIPIIIEGQDGALAGALPAYLKTHSQGEYVFDHSWADAYTRSGGQYYPKIQIAAPFSPVPGPRVLAHDPQYQRALLAAVKQVVTNNGFSSAHASFIAVDQLPVFEAAGWLIREGVQFHWENRDYPDFEAFLAQLASRKRKAIRKERLAAQQSLSIRTLRGAEIEPHHWDAFWIFYQDTGARKWGQPYLTRAFFDQIACSMGDDLLMFVAEREGKPIAGALNLIGPDCLYGRYWGCVEEVPFLHFELCYYQAIEWAIAHRLARVEAGAQGEHKLARGYLAAPTWSAHFIADRGFRTAVGDFLTRERRAMERQIEFLADMGPFKRGR